MEIRAGRRLVEHNHYVSKPGRKEHYYRKGLHRRLKKLITDGFASRLSLWVSDEDLVVDHIALRFVRYNLCVFGNRYVLLGTATTRDRKGVSVSQPNYT